MLAYVFQNCRGLRYNASRGPGVARKHRRHLDHPELICSQVWESPGGGRPSPFAKPVMPQETASQSILDHSAMGRDLRAWTSCSLRAHALNQRTYYIFQLETIHNETMGETTVSHRLYILLKLPQPVDEATEAGRMVPSRSQRWSVAGRGRTRSLVTDSKFLALSARPRYPSGCGEGRPP